MSRSPQPRLSRLARLQLFPLTVSPNPGCARDGGTAAVFCRSYWYFEHVSDMECQRYWLCRQFLRFDQPHPGFTPLRAAFPRFSNHHHCGLGGQSYQIGFGLISRAIRVIGFSFGFAKERAGRFWRTIAVFCNGCGKHKHCRGVEHFGSRLQRGSLRHDYSSGPLHRAGNVARVPQA